MDIPEPGTVFRLPGKVQYRDESAASTIGLITLYVKSAGERSAGNPHAAFDVAGVGNVEWTRYCDTCERKSKTTGNTNFDLNRRASSRPYTGGRQYRKVVFSSREPYGWPCTGNRTNTESQDKERVFPLSCKSCRGSLTTRWAAGWGCACHIIQFLGTATFCILLVLLTFPDHPKLKNRITYP